MTPTHPTAARPAIGLVLAGQDEFDALRPALAPLRDIGCDVEIFVSSVWAAPERLMAWAERAEGRGLGAIIAAAGSEPQLPGILAAACRLPVIAVPLAAPGRDASRQVELILQTSPAAPVAMVAPGAAEEAALLAMRILALATPSLRNEIEVYRQTILSALEARQQALPGKPASAGPGSSEGRPKPSPTRIPAAAPAAETAQSTWDEDWTKARAQDVSEETEDEEEYEIRPANLDRPLEGKPVQPRQPALPSAVPARVLGRLTVDPDTPDVQVIEEAIDCLLEGGVIAFPTETVYGLAADATNPAAVERLYELKGRPRSKAITLMVDSPKLLGHIACNLTVEARRLMEAFWPGPLTIIFQKRGANFGHVSSEETIGVRLPDHSVPLSIMQALARPLACTSANLAGQTECFTADEVERAFPGQLNLILDGGELPDNPPSTVIDITREPYRILRKGAVTREQIAAVIGEKLEQE